MRDKIIEKLEYARNVRDHYLEELAKLEAKISVYEELLEETNTPAETQPAEEEKAETLETPNNLF